MLNIPAAGHPYLQLAAAAKLLWAVSCCHIGAACDMTVGQNRWSETRQV